MGFGWAIAWAVEVSFDLPYTSPDEHVSTWSQTVEVGRIGRAPGVVAVDADGLEVRCRKVGRRRVEVQVTAKEARARWPEVVCEVGRRTVVVRPWVSHDPRVHTSQLRTLRVEPHDLAIYWRRWRLDPAATWTAHGATGDHADCRVHVGPHHDVVEVEVEVGVGRREPPLDVTCALARNGQPWPLTVHVTHDAVPWGETR